MDELDDLPFVPLVDSIKRGCWFVTAGGITFAMLGEALTRPEALETARRVWPLAEVSCA